MLLTLDRFLWLLTTYLAALLCTASILNIPSIRIKVQAYTSLVWPLVEYASTVWNPYTKPEINKIEAVQRRAARYVVNNQIFS
jgi:hypothetical protein